jgi:hypothetical protein
MRKSPTVRPLVVESLEGRLVLSAATASSPQALAADKVTAAFGAFDQSFSEAVQVDLVTPANVGGGSGYTFFVDQLGPSLETLYVDSVKAMGPGSADTPSAAQIRKLIVGSASNSLESRLVSLSLSYTEYGTSTQSYENEAFDEIRQTYKQVKQIVSAALGSSGTTSTAAATAAPATTVAARAPRHAR